MMDIAEFTFGLLTNVLSSIMYDISKFETLPFLQRRKIKQKVEDATANVIEPLIPFLNNEKIDSIKQQLLIETCINELKPIIDNPSRIFQSSMNGEKLFEEQYRSQPLPQEIMELELVDIYSLLFPRIATIICKIPEAIQYWENEAWSETFTRLDELSHQLQRLFAAVNELDSHASREADDLLLRLRKSRAQKIGLDLDVTGLRADTIITGKFDDFFVHPAIKFDQQNHELIAVSNTAESFNQFVRPYQKTILIGAPGAGKSTWSKWLERQALTNAWSGIPIRIELRGIKNKRDMPITDVFNTIIGNMWSDEMTIDKIKNWNKENQILLIFDGFDEVKPSERDECLGWINDITLTINNCPIILTSRPITTNHIETLGDSWQTWIILPFDEQRIIQYVNKWYAHIPLIAEENRSIDGEGLVFDWSNDTTLEPLTGNPLLLSTLLMVHHLDGKLPTGRAQLYTRYVEGMMGSWDDRRHILNPDIDLNRFQKQQIMRKIALTLLLKEVDELNETEIVSIAASYLQQWHLSLEPTEVIYSLRERTGLIVGPGSYSFSHKSIAEYLVAELIIEGNVYSNEGTRIDRFYLFQQRNNDHWNTVTFLWSGITPLIELENFIIECINVQAYDLGYGLVYDQFERLSPEFSIKIMMSLLSNKNIKILEIDKGTRWIFNYPYGLQEQSSKDYEIRSLRSYQKISFLINKFIESKYLGIDNYNLISPEFKIIFLISLLIYTKDINILNSLLKEDITQYNPYINFVKTSIISERFIIGDLEKDLIEYIHQIDIQLIHMINIISSDIFFINNEADINDNFTYINNVYDLYKKIAKFKVNIELLVSTKRWQYNSFFLQEPDSEFDLLADTSIKLGQIKTSYNDKTCAIIDKFITIIDDLRSMRDSLIEEASK